jgi:hypothetical protein
VIARIDEQDEIEELNEDNNEASSMLVVEELFSELKIEDISFSPKSPVEEESWVEIRVSVKNIGNITSQPATAELYIIKGSIGSEEGFIGSKTIGTLSAGENRGVSFSWKAEPAGTHTVEVVVIEDSDKTEASSVIVVLPKKEKKVELFYTWPNPAKGDTINFRYKIEDEARVKIRVYDLGLSLVAELEKVSGAGYDEIDWDISDLPPGLYIYIFEAHFSDRVYKDKKRLVIIR